MENQQLNDLILIFNQEPTIKFLKSSEIAQSAKRAISWGIYFYERSDVKGARDAFVRAGELVSQVNTHLNDIVTKNLIKKTDNAAELLQIGKELFHKVIMLIECIDTNAKPTSSTTKPSVSEHWSKQNTHKTANNEQKQFSSFKKIMGMFKRKSHEKETHDMSFTKSKPLLKTPSTKPELTKPTLTSASIDMETPTTSSAPSSTTVEAIDNLRERLARVMSDQQRQQQQPEIVPVILTPLDEVAAAHTVRVTSPNMNGKPVTQHNHRPKSTLDKGMSRASSDKRVEVALSQIQNNLSHMLQRGRFENQVTKNAFNALIVSLENLQPMQTAIVKYLERLRQNGTNSTGDDADDIMQQMEYQIYIDVLRIVFDVNYAIKNSLISPRKLEMESSSSVIEQYEKFFELEPLICKLLSIQIYAENFEHTVTHMKELQVLLQQLSEIVRQKDRFDKKQKDLLTKVSQALCHQFQSRIMELKFYYGVDTYASSTHDFENDGLGSLSILLKCLTIWIDIENLVLGADTNAKKLIYQWLRLSVKKMYVVNTENVSMRMIDNEQNHDRPLFQTATKLMHMCDYVLYDCIEVTQRYATCFKQALESFQLSFTDIICIEFSLHLTADIDQYCNECYRHQNERMLNKKGRVEFDLSIALFHKLCPKISTTFKKIKQLCTLVKTYPVCECFYEIIRRCITIPFLAKLTEYCTNAATYDKVEQAYNSSVLYSSSCLDVTTALLKPLGMITELDFCLRMNNPKNTFQSLLIVYLDSVRPIMSNYLQFVRYQFENELMGKKSDDKHKKGVYNVSERIARASLYYNNINGLFIQCKTVLTYFNNNHFFSTKSKDNSVNDDKIDNDDDDEQEDEQIENDDMEDQSYEMIDEDDDESYDIMSMYVQDGNEDGGTLVADVFDLQCVKNIIDDIRNVTHLMAAYFAQWIFSLNEARFRSIFKQDDRQALDVLLRSLDKFFTVLSEHLYLELLHEVLKHLYVLFIQHLLRILLPTNSSGNVTSVSAGSVNNNNSIFSNDFDPTFKTPVEKCVKGFKELFWADGEGIEQDFLDKYSRELEVILHIYNDETPALIQLYKALTSDNVPVLLPQKLSSISENVIDSGVSDSGSVQSDSSSTDSSIIIQNLQQQVIMSTISNMNLIIQLQDGQEARVQLEFLNPELILLLLGMRKKDKDARLFVKKTIHKKK
jgi:hypothetical protein